MATKSGNRFVIENVRKLYDNSGIVCRIAATIFTYSIGDCENTIICMERENSVAQAEFLFFAQCDRSCDVRYGYMCSDDGDH